jgi:hypothetical protein
MLKNDAPPMKTIGYIICAQAFKNYLTLSGFFRAGLHANIPRDKDKSAISTHN